MSWTTPCLIEGALGPRNDRRRKPEQAARQEPADRPVQRPVDVGPRPLRLLSSSQLAVAEDVQESCSADPAFPLAESRVRGRELPGRSAGADETRLERGAKSLCQGGVPARWFHGAVLASKHTRTRRRRFEVDSRFRRRRVSYTRGLRLGHLLRWRGRTGPTSTGCQEADETHAEIARNVGRVHANGRSRCCRAGDAADRLG
jgi:hypothetical protein